MKILRTFATLLLCFALLAGTSSCITISKSNNGKHKGWFKNTKKHHHSISTHPGKAKGHSKKK